jgi:hypothetical protein
MTQYYSTTSDIANQVFGGAGGNKWDRSTYDFIEGTLRHKNKPSKNMMFI